MKENLFPISWAGGRIKDDGRDPNRKNKIHRPKVVLDISSASRYENPNYQKKGRLKENE
jgi:hypothetical protein